MQCKWTESTRRGTEHDTAIPIGAHLNELVLFPPTVVEWFLLGSSVIANIGVVSVVATSFLTHRQHACRTRYTAIGLVLCMCGSVVSLGYVVLGTVAATPKTSATPLPVPTPGALSG
jgi:hypothetical protein